MMYIAYFDAGVSDAPRPVTDFIPVPGLQSGRVVRIGANVGSARIVLSLDGTEVADIAAGEVAVQPYVPNLDVWGVPGTGIVRVRAVRLDLLPEGRPA
jgi:hypothetical protein